MGNVIRHNIKSISMFTDARARKSQNITYDRRVLRTVKFS